MMRNAIIFALLLSAGAAVSAGTWSNTLPADLAADVYSDGILVRATNLGTSAIPVNLYGIAYGTDNTGITGGANWSSAGGKYYNGTNTAIFNLLNNGRNLNTWGGGNDTYIALSDLVVGKSYRLQVLIGFDWVWCAAALYGKSPSTDYSYFADNTGNRVGVARYSWVGDAATRTIRVNRNNASIMPLAFVLHEVINNDASTPSPANKATLIEPSGLTLSWKTGTTDGTVIDPRITKHYLYIREGEPNFIDVTPIAIPVGSPAQATGSYGPNNYNLDSKYYWRVDECLNDAPLTDPNGIIRGSIWRFDTKKSTPEISQQPAYSEAPVGGSGQMSLTVGSISPATFAWYKGASGDTTVPMGAGTYTVNGTIYTASLNLTNVQKADQATYWCRITNGGGSVNSNAAWFGVLRQVGHWTMNSADFNGTQYADLSGEGNHATPNGAPAFVTGISGEAVEVGTTGWASAGTFMPSQATDHLTVSAWVKWDGTAFTANGQGIVGKRDAGGLHWMLVAQNGDTSHPGNGWVRFTMLEARTDSARGDIWFGPNALPAGEWVHIAATIEAAGAFVGPARLYINGVEKAIDSQWHYGNLTGATAAAVMIGNNIGGGTWPGQLDDVRLYNYPLGKYGVADLYYGTSGKPVCIDSYGAEFDHNGDCKVGIDDLEKFIDGWLDCGLFPTCN